MEKQLISILGAGSWGTAIAIHLSNYGYPVMLWGRNSEHILQIKQEHCNHKYLPAIYFPKLLTPTSNLEECINKSKELIIAVPSYAFSNIINKINQLKKPLHYGLSWLTKGMDPISNKLFSQLIETRFGKIFPIAVISGPSFANEVAKFLPTALILASNHIHHQTRLKSILQQSNLKIYLSKDIIGVQLCGAIKNILAIACGISDGFGYGSNAKLDIITRGLYEMSMLGKKMGAKQETFMGLAGVGDLFLTCMDNQSRNRRFGIYLGQGKSIQYAEQKIGQVIEGKNNAEQICNFANKFNINMPICYQINSLLKEKTTVYQAACNLVQYYPNKKFQ